MLIEGASHVRLCFYSWYASGVDVTVSWLLNKPYMFEVISGTLKFALETSSFLPLYDLLSILLQGFFFYIFGTFQ